MSVAHTSLRTAVARVAFAVSAIGGMLLAALPRQAAGQTYTWSGTSDLWNTTNWVTSTGTTTFPAGSSGTNTAIINSGTVSFAGSDTFGNSSNTSSPVIRIGSGGTLARRIARSMALPHRSSGR